MLKLILKNTFIFICAMVFVWVIVPVSADARIYDSVVRLHVLADSDSEEDQQIKLRVRDSLLEYISGLTADCRSRDQALNVLGAKKEDIESYVNGLLNEWGIREYTAKIKLGTESYDTREYDGFRLPAGEYASLQVILGSGSGKNWWCVLFPPVCLESSQAEDQLVASGIGGESVKVFTVDSGQYRFRFRLLEFFGELF